MHCEGEFIGLVVTWLIGCHPRGVFLSLVFKSPLAATGDSVRISHSMSAPQELSSFITTLILVFDHFIYLSGQCETDPQTQSIPSRHVIKSQEQVDQCPVRIGSIM